MERNRCCLPSRSAPHSGPSPEFDDAAADAASDLVGAVRGAVDDALEGATERPNVNRRSYELLGDAWRELNELSQAREAFKKAGAVEKLRDIGEHDLADRVERRRSRSRAFDQEKAAVGDNLVASGNIQRAIAMYRDAGAYDKLVSLGDVRAAAGDSRGLSDAHRAYVAAGAVERLRTLAKETERRGWFDSALRSLIAAGDRDGAERIGDAAIQTAANPDALTVVLNAYRFAGARGKLVLLGRKYLAMGDADRALSAFRAAARLEGAQ